VSSFFGGSCSFLIRWALDWFFQGHRYDILEDVGCFPYVFNSWFGFLMCWSWPIILGVISGIYGSAFPLPLSRRRLALTSCVSCSTDDSRIREASESVQGVLVGQQHDGSGQILAIDGVGDCGCCMHGPVCDVDARHECLVGRWSVQGSCRRAQADWARVPGPAGLLG
jgi:hypothetical protein